VNLFAHDEVRPGMLVTIDGPNASGKTSLSAALCEELRGAGAAVHLTRQPSPTPLGDYVRSSEPGVRGRALACLVAADRHRQCEEEIAPHLASGEIVLCDRYLESSLVLQRLDGVEQEFILAINAGIPRPDLRLQLRASEDVLSERLASRAPDSDRRLERGGGPARELQLYDEADRYLADIHDLPATVFDTSATKADQLAASAAKLVLDKRSRWTPS
jgi:dTMP kinase